MGEKTEKEESSDLESLGELNESDLFEISEIRNDALIFQSSVGSKKRPLPTAHHSRIQEGRERRVNRDENSEEESVSES